VLARRIHALLNRDGYTVKGVQKLLAEGEEPTPAPAPAESLPLDDLRAIRAILTKALEG
jgi:hypothetical protein